VLVPAKRIVGRLLKLLFTRDSFLNPSWFF
jgi:hypothetical protein